MGGTPCTGKKSHFFKVFKEPGKKCITMVSKDTSKNALMKDHGGFQQQSPQRLVDGYYHMNGRNHC